MVKAEKGQPIHVLNVGTKLLTRDVMDQYLRSLGNVKTYYASKLSAAIAAIREKKPHLIICEESFPEGNAVDLIEAIGGLSVAKELYFVIAVEKVDGRILSLVGEMGINEILEKPFTTSLIQQIVNRYTKERDEKREPWKDKLFAARKIWDEGRGNEAEANFKMLLNEFKDNEIIMLEAAEVFVKRKQFDLAIPLLDRLAVLQPGKTRVLQLLGISFLQSNKPREAILYFEKAKEKSSGNSRRFSLMAEAYLMMAEKEVQEGLVQESDNSNFILQKLRFLMARRDYASVINYFENRKPFLSDEAKKEADVLAAVARKLGGFRA